MDLEAMPTSIFLNDDDGGGDDDDVLLKSSSSVSVSDILL